MLMVAPAKVVLLVQSPLAGSCKFRSFFGLCPGYCKFQSTRANDQILRTLFTRSFQRQHPQYVYPHLMQAVIVIIPFMTIR